MREKEYRLIIDLDGFRRKYRVFAKSIDAIFASLVIPLGASVTVIRVSMCD